jgi:Leucine-rich repeat (LRR) protein
MLKLLACLLIQAGFVKSLLQYYQYIDPLWCNIEDKPCAESPAVYKFCSGSYNMNFVNSDLYCNKAVDGALILDKTCDKPSVICYFLNPNIAEFPQFSKNKYSKSFYLVRISEKNYKLLPDFSFQSLAIEHIILEANQIETVEKRAFVGISGLRSLNLYDNKIEEIELNYLSELERIILSGNRILKIDKFMFMNLTFLKILDLHLNKIEAIEKDAFVTNIDLRHLDLSSNKLKSLNVNLILKRLVSFHLNENNIESLTDNVFSNLKSLKILMMDKNDFVILDPNELVNLTKLTYLSLDNNYFDSIDLDELVFDMIELVYLSIMDNGIETIRTVNLNGTCKRMNK